MLNTLHPDRQQGGIQRRLQRGLSLVELMVGISVGLFIVAAAATLTTTQLTSNRKLLLEVQLQQDLRATADIVTRELRRAGTITDVTSARDFVWSPGTNWATEPGLTAVTLVPGNSSTINYRYYRIPGENGPFGFKLQDYAVWSELADAGWQQLTDRATMKVTRFEVTARPQPPVVVACSKLCAGGGKACWPRITVRSYSIDITAQSMTDEAVVRSVRSVVRMKNDLVSTDPALGTRACPA